MFSRCVVGVHTGLKNVLTTKSPCLKSLACSLHTANHIPLMDANMERLEINFNPRDKDSHNSSVIMLHGVGDTGFYMAPYAVDLSKTLPTTRFICPTAPEINLSCRNGAKHHAWFDFPSWDEEGNNKCTGVEESCEIVNALIQQEIEKGIDPQKILLCGFSQGAGIALHTAYNCDVPIGGVIGFCGCLPNDHSFTINEKCKDTECLLFHGTMDRHVPIEFMQKASELIRSKGVKKVQFNTYPGVKHTITRRMLDFTREEMIRKFMVWFVCFHNSLMFSRIVRNCSQLSCRAVKSQRFFATLPVFSERLDKWNSLFSENQSNIHTSSTLINVKSNGNSVSSVNLGSSVQSLPGYDNCQLCYINGKLSDVDSTLKEDSSVEFIPCPVGDDSMFSRDKSTKDYFKTMWHSSTHILAYALEQYYGDKVQLIHGPSGEGVPYCFFYEVTLSGGAPTDKDLKNIQKLINKLLKQDLIFEHLTLTKEQALDLFSQNSYKQSIIQSLSGPISVYKCGEFIDLCRGPHIHSSKSIAQIKLTSANFVESKEDSLPHYRFYGNSFVSQSACEYYQKMMKEAKERDHRVIGKKLDLFLFDPNSQGNVFFLDRGLFIYNKLCEYMKDYNLQGYKEIASPLMFKSDLWKISGHYDHYRENMFNVKTSDVNEEIYLKPMNCPSHCLVFNNSNRSYRDLPLRYAEFTAIHRQENSGALGGLTRLNMFHQDDGHIFCRKDQIAEEITGLLQLIKRVYDKLHFRYSFVLSTQPADSVGKSDEWKETESLLKNILETQELQYTIEEGDGAFYAPKIDVLIQDSICRYHQCGTIQLDVQLPKKFGLKYKNAEGESETPILIHRAIYGSLERFMGVFIEHCNGCFPLFFSPYQVAFLPVSETSQLEHCNNMAKEIMKEFRGDLNVDVLPHDTSLGKRVRECAMKHYNYVVTVGDEELKNNMLSIRSRQQKEISQMSLADFKDLLQKELIRDVE